MEINKDLLGSLKLPLPGKFSGRYEDWEDWSWTFKTYMNMMEPTLAPYMDSCCDMALELTDEDLKDPDSEQITKSRVLFSRKLHYLLALITEDAAKLVVRQNLTGNGFETWRLLCQKFTLPGTTRDVGLLSQILGFSFSESDFQKDFDRWEDLKKKYERDTKSTIPDSVLIALLVGKTRGALLTHLRLNLAGLKTYQKLREEILQYHKTVHVLNQDGNTSKGPAPMDVDALINALQSNGPEGLVAALHGKGYYRNKGKGKGLGHFTSNNFGSNNFNSFNNKGKGKGNFKGKGSHFKSKGKGKGFNFKGNKGKGKGKTSKGGKGKGLGQPSSLGSNTSQPQQRTINALEADSSATSGSEQIQWGETSLGSESWNTSSDTWGAETWEEASASDWFQDEGWVAHLSSDWDDPSWQDWTWGTSGDWTWEDSNSIVSYPSTAVSAVTAAPPGLELPKSDTKVRFATEVDTSDQTNTSTTVATSSRPSQGTTPGPRSGVAGLFVATMLATFTLGQSLMTHDTCLTDRKYVFGDPLLVNNLNANFSPDENTVLFDSGASVHCCPLKFGESWPLLPLHGVVPQLKSVSGDPITVYGKRIVGIELDNHVCYLHFYVCDVHLPVVSVSRLTAQGYITHLAKDNMTLTSPSGEEIKVHCTGPMFYLQPNIVDFKQNDFDYICSCMVSQLASTTSGTSNTLVAGASTVDTSSSKKPVFYHADRWKLEGHTLTRLHKRPRKTLFVPLGTKDMPLDVEELVDVRTTEVIYADGRTQTLEDNWRTSDDPTKILDTEQTWTGKTVFKLKSGPPDRRLRTKTDTTLTKEPQLKILSEGTTSTSTSSSSRPVVVEKRLVESTHAAFGTESFRQLVLKLRAEPDSDTGRAKTSDCWHRLPNSWIRFHYVPRTTMFIPSLDDAQLEHGELGTRRMTLKLDQNGRDTWINDTCGSMMMLAHVM